MKSLEFFDYVGKKPLSTYCQRVPNTLLPITLFLLYNVQYSLFNILCNLFVFAYFINILNCDSIQYYTIYEILKDHTESFHFAAEM